jgi:hypothetical protein
MMSALLFSYKQKLAWQDPYLVAQCLQCVLDDVQGACDGGMWSYDAIKVHETEREFRSQIDLGWGPPRDGEDARIGEPRVAREESLHAVLQRRNRRAEQSSNGRNGRLTG